jgi:hypothetical protein
VSAVRANELLDTPVVFEDLDEGECALWAILQDHSGIDQAEFLWYDADTDDGCWRAWDFQWAWWRCEAALQVDQSARSVGKSLGIKLRACAFPNLFPGQEMVVTAPELVHLEPIINLIETQIESTRFYREQIPRTRSAVTHRPFRMNFTNGARIMGRIPQRDGKGVKGIHPIWLELDEGQDFPAPGWVELIETLKRGHEGAIWRAHGVTRGVRDHFYQITQDTPDNKWTVHRIPAMMRPNWSDEERSEKIQQYGSRDDPDYRRNVLGLHGDATNPMFVLYRLMGCTDTDQTSDYNANEYYAVSIKSETLQFAHQEVADVLDFPARHLDYVGEGKAKALFWAGMDVGYTVDPTEILVFVEYRHKPRDPASRLRLLTRVHLERVGHAEQVSAILSVIRFYRPKAFAMDKTGLGLPLFTDLQERCRSDPELLPALDIIKGYAFGEKVLVDLDSSVEIPEWANLDETVRAAGMRRSVLEHASDLLRSLVDAGRLELPWDTELLRQFQGSTWSIAKSLDLYGRKLFCVDQETECLTRSGWARHDQLQEGQEILAFDPEAWSTRWSPLEAVNRFDDAHEMLLMENQSHSSLTTLNHRWIVERHRRLQDDYVREWRTSKNLRGRLRIPRLAPPSDSPAQAKHSDALVELVAWAWTEGHFERRVPGAIQIVQSATVNPDNVARIRSAIRGVLGSAGWGEWPSGPVQKFRIHQEHGRGILEHFVVADWTASGDQDKVVTTDFLLSLTKAQLQLFVDTCLAADGSCSGGHWLFTQRRRNRVEAFQTACTLLGLPTHVYLNPTRSGPYAGTPTWTCSILTTGYFTPPTIRAGLGRTKAEIVRYQGVVWCPTVPMGAWVARRNGTIYVTGNSKGNDHILDGARMAVLGQAQHSVDEMLSAREPPPVLDVFVQL